MAYLENDWLTEGMIDFEYKKYILLAYLQDIRKKFNATELYPFLSDLIFHYRNLKKVHESKELLYENFPKSISKADFQKLKINYRHIVEDHEIMKEMADIIGFAMPRLERTINEGKELFDFVEENLELTPVGLTPIYTNEGYVMVSQDLSRNVSVFRYQLTMFESANEKYRGLNTDYLEDYTRSMSQTFEAIKLDLIKKHQDLPNPATYLVVSKLKFPLPQTLMPVAKRLLVRELNMG